ncbi:MAG TPA: cyclodeaminase/cyclohydrolase family protein [Gaiellaceae bacterium]|jgi:formiminotetrahydrofolate cyclodeaminase|nr:cyclodeaminase/cyclohydrolase family protein [Gaiellaceae bacterium]
MAAARVAGDTAGAAMASSLATRLDRLAEEDARVYSAAVSALPDVDPAESSPQRDFALGTLLDVAADVPLRIAEACADVAELARTLAERVDPALGPDLEVAARVAVGAARGAAHLVEINLVVAEDDPRAARARAIAELR